MIIPPISKGDLLLASAGPDAFSTVLALLDIAREAVMASITSFVLHCRRELAGDKGNRQIA